jgi:tetratricopeptide (TPR) repeat protein
VQTIVSTLVGRVQASDAERSRRKPPANLAAYECVLQGNAISWDDAAGAAEATRLFEKAIEVDPGYAIAHALLAALRYARWRDESGDSDELLNEAYVLAKRAVELDDGDSTCHSILAQVLLLRRSFDQAMQYARRAVEINPNNQWNCADLGSILVYTGRSEEALDWFARAREIDPYFDPAWYWRAQGQAHMHLQQYAEAAAKFSHARVRPYRMLALLAGCQAELGDMDRARISVADCLAEKPGFTISHYMRKEPFQLNVEAERVEAALRRAGLPA